MAQMNDNKRLNWLDADQSRLGVVERFATRSKLSVRDSIDTLVEAMGEDGPAKPRVGRPRGSRNKAAEAEAGTAPTATNDGEIDRLPTGERVA